LKHDAYCALSFNPKTYRAIGRRLSASNTPRYLVTYENAKILKKYHYKGLNLITKLNVSMTGAGGRCEHKTAYFYSLNKGTGEANQEGCDPAFAEALSVSKLPTGERYQKLILQVATFQNHNKSSVATRRTQNNSNRYIYESDSNTEQSSDSDPISDSELEQPN